MFNNKKKKDNFEAEEVEEIIELDEEKEEDESEALPFVSYRDEKASIFEKEDLSSPPVDQSEEPEEEPEVFDYSLMDKETTDASTYIEDPPEEENMTFDYSSFGKDNQDPDLTGSPNEDAAPDSDKPDTEETKKAEDTTMESFEDNSNHIVEPVSEVEENEPEKIQQKKVTFKEKLLALFKKKNSDNEIPAVVSEEGLEQDPVEPTDDSILDVEPLNDSELPEDNDLISAEESTEEETVTPASKKGLKLFNPKGNNRPLFLVLAGLLLIGIVAAVLFLPKSDSGFIGGLFGEEEDLLTETPSTLPIPEDNLPPEEGFEEGSEGPFIEEVEEEKVDKNLPVEDAYTEELKTRLSPVFMQFNSKLTEVSKTKGVIHIKGDVKTEDLMEINRLVRVVQSTSYPFLIDGLVSTNVQLSKGKTLYSFETSKTVIEFIAKLNYEDRHSAQMWWSKTTAHKNGRNLKASLVKDRLYVDYPHPIFEEAEVEQATEGAVEDQKEGVAEKPLNPEDYETYATYENKDYGLFFDHPRDTTVGGSVDTESNKLTVSSKTDKILPLSFKVEAGEEKIEGSEQEKLAKFFAASTSALEKANTNYKVNTEESSDTNFTGQKFLIRNYTVKDSTVDYSVILAATVIGDKTYLFTIIHSEDSQQDAKWIYKSSNLGETALLSLPNEDGEKEEEKKETPKKDVAAGACTINGDKESKTYYLAGADGYDKVEKGNLMLFCDEDSATKAGYKKGA